MSGVRNTLIGRAQQDLQGPHGFWIPGGGSKGLPDMIQASDTNPILARPHTLRGLGRIRLIGSGEIVIRLEGRGHAKLRRGRNDSAQFTGAGRLRHVSSERLVISGATGHLTLEGAQIEVEFDGGPISVSVQGRFSVETEGCGRVETSRGDRVHWGTGHTRFRLEGPRLVLTTT